VAIGDRFFYSKKQSISWDLILKSNKMYVIGIFILSLALVTISNATALTWIFYDAVDDVTYMFNDAAQNSGDYQDEIDIVSIELDASEVVLTFQDVPQDDEDHYYLLHIFWSQTNFINRTDGNFGKGDNMMWTYLQNSTGHTIVNNIENNSIYISADTLRMPIPEFILITNSSNPKFIQIESVVFSSANQYFYDIANSTTFTQKVGFNSLTGTITFVSAVSTICLIIIRKKKKT